MRGTNRWTCSIFDLRIYRLAFRNRMPLKSSVVPITLSQSG